MPRMVRLGLNSGFIGFGVVIFLGDPREKSFHLFPTFSALVLSLRRHMTKKNG